MNVEGSGWRIEYDERLVEWWIEPAGATRIRAPWGEIWLGESRGGGQEVWVEAEHPFDLLLHFGGASFYEHAPRGRHRFLLTVLDRTDVV